MWLMDSILIPVCGCRRSPWSGESGLEDGRMRLLGSLSGYIEVAHPFCARSGLCTTKNMAQRQSRSFNAASDSFARASLCDSVLLVDSKVCTETGDVTALASTHSIRLPG